jgi:hypothetical protein
MELIALLALVLSLTIGVLDWLVLVAPAESALEIDAMH